MGRRRPSGDVGSGTLASPRDRRPGSTRNRGRAWVIGLPRGMGVAPLEAAALAVGRLDAALSGHPPLPVRTFWGQLDTARHHAEVDGRRVDLLRLAAFPPFLHALLLRVVAILSLAKWGGDITALAVELRSWIVQPDPGQ